MSISSKLTQRLQRVDGSAPAIQAAAGELMRQYDANTEGAVLEWRNALFNARTEQILPLLYVANEVMQNSKRNRGTKYLEAFSQVLPQSLEYMADNLPKDVERIRRVIKIWGDRHVLSIRFINDVLLRLEPYRESQRNMMAAIAKEPLSPQLSPIQHAPTKGDQDTEETAVDLTEPEKDDDDDDDDIMQILEGKDKEEEDDDDDDDEMFAESSSQPKLEIDVNIGAMPIEESSSVKKTTTSRTKRRRGSGSGSSRNVLSCTNMVDLWTQLKDNQQDVDLIMTTLNDLRANAKERAADLSSLVGDKLIQAVKKNHRDKLSVIKYRRKLYNLAKERREIELQAVRYYHWIVQSIRADASEMELADTVEAKIQMWAPLAEKLVAARTARREHEAAMARAQEEQRQREREAAEAAAFRATALAKETEAKPGMVWNPTTREYQALNTDESWRD